ncbi:hypothetical protein [Piscibacillus halophilus]|uniref:hypothetical protein n=1 Tax=Piscibacillus halophilus TaxID=571933 RepID=UPI00158F01A1|nr:hypothetical protein [Piscibacillus halophilus]
MEINHGYQSNWKIFSLFTIIIGLMVGVFSVKSDHLLYVGEDGTLSIVEMVIAYISVMINSLPVWFIASMVVGYLFGNNIKEGMLKGAIYTVTAITFYFLIGHYFIDSLIQVSIFHQIKVYLIWYGASIIGGCLGGGTGYLYRKSPNVLFIVLLGLILQLFVNGASSWNNMIGTAQNITFCLMTIGIVVYLVIVNRKKFTHTDFHKKNGLRRS